jgi:hypothetical protein
MITIVDQIFRHSRGKLITGVATEEVVEENHKIIQQKTEENHKIIQQKTEEKVPKMLEFASVQLLFLNDGAVMT